MAHRYDYALSQPASLHKSIAAKLQRIDLLNDHQLGLLTELETDERHLPADYTLLKAGESASKLYAIQDGWALSEARTHAGRSIVALHLPGDIIGEGIIPFQTPLHTTVTLSDCTVTSFSHATLEKTMRQSPRIARLFMVLSIAQQQMSYDRIAMLTRAEAGRRLAHFILEIYARFKFADPMLGDTFRCPLTQKDLGDATGLTSIHVSRTLSRLHDLNLLSRTRESIHIRDWPGLLAYTGFRNRYADLTTTITTH